jgi:hypothetical protein
MSFLLPLSSFPRQFLFMFYAMRGRCNPESWYYLEWTPLDELFRKGSRMQCSTALSATTGVSDTNTQVFHVTLTALTEPRTHWWTIKCHPAPGWWVALHTDLFYFAPGMWWHTGTIRTTMVFQSLQGLQFWCSGLHNVCRCLCLSSANSPIVPLPYCYILDAALSPYMFSFEILSLIAI